MAVSLKLWGIALVAFLILDFIWLGLISSKIYVSELAPIGRIQGDKFKPVLWAGLIVYALMAAGVVFFVLPNISDEAGVLSIFLHGAALGLVVFGVYDFTNYSILKDWTVFISIVDVLWGTFAWGVVTTLTSWAQDMM